MPFVTPVLANLRFDFGYPWWLSYGQVVVLLPAFLLLLVSWKFKWAVWSRALLSVLVLWSGAALLVTRFVFDVNGVPSLPAQDFLHSRNGRVLDLGAGTGRSSIMVLKSRPQATLVALDLFAESFEQHFGHSDSPEQKLLANLKAAGVDARAAVQKGDMRELPFEPATFDAVVSAYAVDHLNRKGISESLAEAARVVKPGGDFLLILIGKEPWGQFAFGPLLMHMGSRGPDWWTARLEEAHFKVVEHGVQPVTLYFLARRR